MPLRYFKCGTCFEVKQMIFGEDVNLKYPCPCGGEFKKLSLSHVTAPTVTEKVGKYWNKNLKVNIKAEMYERSKEHMRSHEMHDLIARNGIDKMKHHPLMKDGRIRKKGE